MSKRINLSKKQRFEVLKRDSFTCQYCGQSAPTVTLEVDHIIPVAKGGTNEITNLITACFDCNSGKSDRQLNDDAVITKQKAQLDELNERRMQLEMMAEWRKGLSELDDIAFNIVCDEFKRLINCNIRSDEARSTVRKWVKQYQLPKLLEAIKDSCVQYVKTGQIEEVEKAFKMIPRIMRMKETAIPEMKDLFYIRGILKNKIYNLNENGALIFLKETLESGMTVQELMQFTLGFHGSSWNVYTADVYEFLRNKNKLHKQDC